MEKSLQDSLKNALGVLTIVLLLLSVYIVVQIFAGSKTKGDFDTITVDASAETFMAPDIAEISFSVAEENKDLSVAQEAVDTKIKTTISSLKEIGIEEKDIKTTYYNANPRYEYGKAICLQYRCDDGERALVGYEANQSISVTIRNLDNVGKVISSLGSVGVSNIYGPNFRVENEDDLKAKVREEAIAKAKEKAKVLAKNLDVRIVGIENFSEGYNGGMYYAKAEMGMAEDSVMSAPVANITLPTGENKIETTVTITYRVK
jgi:uncharacterized protein YggE